MTDPDRINALRRFSSQFAEAKAGIDSLLAGKTELSEVDRDQLADLEDVLATISKDWTEYCARTKSD